MSELRVGASVEGADGHLGHVDALVVDPVARDVTHLVVAWGIAEPRVLLPVAAVASSDPDVVRVGIDAAALRSLEHFDEPSYLSPEGDWVADDLVLSASTYYLEPFATPIDAAMLADHERVPAGEVAVRRGMAVHSADGTHVGQVDELLVDPTDGHVTHLVLRQGHLLRHDDDVVIPVGTADRFEDGRVVLSLDLPAVEALEKIPVHRHGHVHDPDDG